MPERPKVGAKIRRARKLLGLTQQQAAGKVGVSRNTWDAWENDRSYPARYDVALEQAFGISLDEDPPPPGPFDDLYPLHEEWEAGVLADPDLPDRIKRQLIADSRAARAVYAGRKRAQEGRSPRRAAG